MTEETFVQNSPRPDVAVIGGAGHVGLPLSLVLANCGFRVLIYDINPVALADIGRGRFPFLEDGGEELLHTVLPTGRLELTTDPSRLYGVPVLIVTIGTPVDEFMSPTLKRIRQCFDELLPFLHGDQLIILRSTVYPGVTQWLDDYLTSRGVKIKVAFCPERIVQGHAIHELRALPQIISGTSKEAVESASALFRTVAPETVTMTPMEAEFAKLFSNAYRYIQFAVANQFYMMAASAGVDYYRVLEGLKHNYPRARDIPGAGFAAGPCLFKDTMQLSAFYRNQFSIGYAAMLANEGLPAHIIETIRHRFGELRQLRVGLLGMAFKADSDDPRSSLSYKLKKMLAFQVAQVLTTDPFVTGDPDIIPLELVLAESDVVVLCAPHTVYRDLQPDDRFVDIWGIYASVPVRSPEARV
jgi:UDP-N-acetyl-D-mannosaminuronic acid dehydrogenase